MKCQIMGSRYTRGFKGNGGVGVRVCVGEGGGAQALGFRSHSAFPPLGWPGISWLMKKQPQCYDTFSFLNTVKCKHQLHTGNTSHADKKKKTQVRLPTPMSVTYLTVHFVAMHACVCVRACVCLCAFLFISISGKKWARWPISSWAGPSSATCVFHSGVVVWGGWREVTKQRHHLLSLSRALFLSLFANCGFPLGKTVTYLKGQKKYKREDCRDRKIDIRGQWQKGRKRKKRRDLDGGEGIYCHTCEHLPTHILQVFEQPGTWSKGWLWEKEGKQWGAVRRRRAWRHIQVVTAAKLMSNTSTKQTKKNHFNFTLKTTFESPELNVSLLAHYSVTCVCKTVS